jgi:hypothetical protein
MAAKYMQEAAKAIAGALEIDRDELKDEFCRLPGDLNYFNDVYAKCVHKYSEAKRERELVEANLRVDFDFMSVLTDKLGKKPSLSDIDRAVVRHPDYQDAKELEILAERDKTRAYGWVDALRAKKDLVMSLGAFVREELRDPYNGRGE